MRQGAATTLDATPTAMTTQGNPGTLLDTKFYAPKRRRGMVPRPLLTERLRRGTQSALTLISAPVGFGKSSLLSEWLATAPAEGWVTAWLSLEPSDNDPVVFWAHVIAALQTAAPGVGGSASSRLESNEPSIEAVLAPLLNELNAVPQDIVLVLDDYHAIDAPQIQVGMAFMLEHLPGNVHLVMTTRADPALPLARLRARGELTEIRAADLRFTPDEAAAYFNEVMGLALTAPDVAALESRTEGWIAALQLAALSMQGRDDVAGFIAGFTGDDRYIVDYLVEEVLHHQTDGVRSFLLQTSILARLSGPLCDTVTGQEGGKATLEALDRGNLFLIPLDDRRRWYRYHHLFADVLQARLLDEMPEQVAELHRRATEWYERDGDRHEAIRHAMAGGDLARAADLVELEIPLLTRLRQETTLRQWLEALPDDLLRLRPVLSDTYAGSLLVRGEVDGVEERLRDAERWFDATGTSAAEPSAGAGAMVVVDEVAFRRLPGSIAVHRAGLALILGDVAGTMAHAHHALDVAEEDDHLDRGGGAALLALASWTTGDLEAASRSYAAAMASLEKAGHLSDVIGCALAHADIRLALGRPREALRTYERGLALANRRDGLVLRGAADMHVGISGVLRERNDLDGAAQQLVAAAELGEENGLPQNHYRSRVARAGIRQAQGDLDGALELLSEAKRLYVADFSPDVRPVAALQARAWIALGRLSEASDWASEHDLAAADELTYVREFEHATLARLLLAQGARDRSAGATRAAIGLLERLLAAADEGGRNGSVIELLVSLSLAHQANDDMTTALRLLERAIAFGEPEGYLRVFVDEGAPMAALLKLATKQRDASSYGRLLLAAFVAPASRTTVEQPLIEPLSERELEVLRLLESDLDGPDIARELSVSLSTVRTHTRNVYAKLGVNSRRAAISRAAELGLLSRTRDHRPSA